MNLKETVQWSALFLAISATPASALTIGAGQSLWITVDAPDGIDFNGMSLFWGTSNNSGSLEYYKVWGPTGYAGPATTDANGGNLAIFHDEHITFELKAGASDVSLRDDAYLWDGSITDGKNGASSANFGSAAPFVMGFYELGETGSFIETWIDRDALSYVVGTYSFAAPASHGSLFYQHGSISLQGSWHIRSDFSTPVPEPATMLLFGTGLSALAGAVRRRMKK